MILLPVNLWGYNPHSSQIIYILPIDKSVKMWYNIGTKKKERYKNHA